MGAFTAAAEDETTIQADPDELPIILVEPEPTAAPGNGGSNAGDSGNSGNSGDTGNGGNSDQSGNGGNAGNSGDSGNSGGTPAATEPPPANDVPGTTGPIPGLGGGDNELPIIPIG